MATDRDSLLADADVRCYACASPGDQQLIQLGLLKTILLNLDSNADTSTSALLEAAQCYACASPGQWTLIELGLLQRIAEAAEG